MNILHTVKTTQYTRHWFDKTYGKMIASINLELDSETFHARAKGYYVGHFPTMVQASDAVMKALQPVNGQR